MKVIFRYFFLLMVVLFISNCKTTKEQDLINEQVWIPFMKAYSEYDVETFIDLHAEEMIRVNPDNGKVRTKEAYANDIKEWWPKNKAKGKKIVLKLRFTERIANENIAFEKGIYKTTYLQPDGTSESHYGLFQVALEKINSVWKITIDSDSNYGKTIGESDFLEGVSIE